MMGTQTDSFYTRYDPGSGQIASKTSQAESKDTPRLA